MEMHLRTELVLAALEIALAQRQPHEAIHTPTMARNTPPWPSAIVAKPWASVLRWVRWATVMTTQWQRVSSQALSASCWPSDASGTKPKRGLPYSNTSRAGTTRIAYTLRWAIYHRSTSNGGMPHNTRYTETFNPPRNRGKSNETPVAMLSPGKGSTHRAYIWSYSSTQFDGVRAVIYDFAETRAAAHPKQFSWAGAASSFATTTQATRAYSPLA
jgi:Transposase IS66 family